MAYSVAVPLTTSDIGACFGGQGKAPNWPIVDPSRVDELIGRGSDVVWPTSDSRVYIMFDWVIRAGINIKERALMRSNKSNLPSHSTVSQSNLMSPAKDSWSNLLAFNLQLWYARAASHANTENQSLTGQILTVLSNDRCNARLRLLLTPNLLACSWQ